MNFEKYYKWTTKWTRHFILPGYSKVPQQFHRYAYFSQDKDLGKSVLIIPIGYSWDGCTPKFKVGKRFVIGVWDGPHGILKFPTLVHDVLYQYCIGTRKQADKEFLRRMREVHFIFAGVYYIVIRLLGWYGWNKHKRKMLNEKAS